MAKAAQFALQWDDLHGSPRPDAMPPLGSGGAGRPRLPRPPLKAEGRSLPSGAIARMPGGADRPRELVDLGGLLARDGAQLVHLLLLDLDLFLESLDDGLVLGVLLREGDL